jgi:exopolysaccharide biosynthesis polyprenyl glycosylphosphotransferase
VLRERKELIHRLAVCVDAAVVGASFLLAFMLRDNLELHYLYLHPLPPFSDYLPILLLVIPLWVFTIRAFGAYDSMREKRFSRIFWAIFEASLAATLVFATASFMFKLDFVSRAFLIIFFATTVTSLTLERWIMLFLLRRVRRKGYNFRVMLIVGSGERAERFAQTIDAHPEWGIRIMGFLDDPGALGKLVGKWRVIGLCDNLARILDENVVDEVVFITPRQWLDRVEGFIRVCEKIGVKATLAIDFFDTAIAKPVVKDVSGWPLLTFDSTPQDFFYLSMKRALDLAGATCGLILLSPLFLLVACAIKGTSRGPVFFRQTRCGLNGRTFHILKFRTMVIDAEKRLKELKKLNEVGGPVFKIRNDPRITAVGRLLRKSSLDELPQLINVFMGDMSLVGPRPPIPAEVEKYERWQRRRLSMRPGITCIHEVMARNNRDFNHWMKLDLEYIDNWSFTLDFKILARTVFAVLRGTGC